MVSFFLFGTFGSVLTFTVFCSPLFCVLWMFVVGSEEHALQWKYCLKKYVDHAGLTEVLNMDFLTDEEED